MAFDAQALFALTYEGPTEFGMAASPGLFHEPRGGSSGVRTRLRHHGTPFAGPRTRRNLDVHSAHREISSASSRSQRDGPGSAPRLLASRIAGFSASRRLRPWRGCFSAANLEPTADIQGLAADTASGLIVAGNDRRMFRSPDSADPGRRECRFAVDLDQRLALDPSHPSNLLAGAVSFGVDGPNVRLERLRFPSGRRSSGRSRHGQHAGHRPEPSTIVATDHASSSGRKMAARPGSRRELQQSRVRSGARSGVVRKIWAGPFWPVAQRERRPHLGTTGPAQSVYSILFDQRHPGRSTRLVL